MRLGFLFWCVFYQAGLHLLCERSLAWPHLRTLGSSPVLKGTWHGCNPHLAAALRGIAPP